VVLAVNPHVVGERRSHAAPAATTVAAVAAGGHEFLVAFVGHLGKVRIRALQAAFLRFPRRFGGAAASGGFASARRGGLGGRRAFLRGGWGIIGRHNRGGGRHPG